MTTHLHRRPRRLDDTLHRVLQRGGHDLSLVPQRLSPAKRGKAGQPRTGRRHGSHGWRLSRTSTFIPSVRKAAASPREALGSSTCRRDGKARLWGRLAGQRRGRRSSESENPAQRASPRLLEARGVHEDEPVPLLVHEGVALLLEHRPWRARRGFAQKQGRREESQERERLRGVCKAHSPPRRPAGASRGVSRPSSYLCTPPARRRSRGPGRGRALT